MASELVCLFDIELPARDGVILRCNLARPAGEGRWPVIVARTPYSKDSASANPVFDMLAFARDGFVVIVQDVRGRGRSDGDSDFVPFVHEQADGVDLTAWAAVQPWSNGEVFMAGGSYQAVANWAAATENPPALRAIATHQSPSSPWRSIFYRGGVPELGAMAAWFMSFGIDTLMRRHAAEPAALGPALMQLVADLSTFDNNGFDYLPLKNFEPLVRSQIGQAWLEMLGNAAGSPMLQALIASQRYDQIQVPVLISGGWYDYFCQGAIDQFIGMRSGAGSELARAHTRLIIGPWTHGSLSSINGERSFGIAAAPGMAGRGGLRAETLRFFRELDSGEPQAPIKLFVMGANTWRDEWEWPLARTRMTPWFLGSSGHANTLNGDGTFTPEPRVSAPDHFEYDPSNPVPTWGGSNLGANELAGPRDQRPIECRDDVLVYTSPALKADLEVTGTVVAELWVASSAVDTDIVARLIDVLPDGTAYTIAEGILRARFRECPDAPFVALPLEPGVPVLFRIELTPTSNLFKAGHQLRLDVTSSCFPRWARNLNTWQQHGATLAQAEIATQTIFHDNEYQSRVLLPIIAS